MEAFVEDTSTEAFMESFEAAPAEVTFVEAFIFFISFMVSSTESSMEASIAFISSTESFMELVKASTEAFTSFHAKH